MEGQIITTVEGIVPENKWQDLKDGYSDIIEDAAPAGILQSHIMQGKSEPTLWRIVTIWESQEKLQAMQQTYSVPPGIKIFKDVGIEPNVKIFDVKNGFTKK